MTSGPPVDPASTVIAAIYGGFAGGLTKSGYNPVFSGWVASWIDFGIQFAWSVGKKKPTSPRVVPHPMPSPIRNRNNRS